MIRRGVCVTVGLLGICFAVAAQQANWRGATENNPAFALNLHKPEIFSAKEHSLLFHRGPVRAWSDGGRLISESAFASIAMAPVELPSSAYLTPNSFGYGPTKNGNAPSNQRPANFGKDAKDSSEAILSPPDRFYYGGEVGFLYGHSSGKGSGDMMESYIMGTVGNDHFQITAGAAFENWSGNGARFRSFALPR